MRKSNNPQGRPKKKLIDGLGKAELAKLRNLVATGSTKEGLRIFFELTNDQFYADLFQRPEVQEMYEKGKELKKTMVLMKQMELAMSGNVPLLIHLGKTECGQSEKTEISGNLEVNNNYDPDMIKKIALAIVNEQH